jgi:hypothetical protein
VLYVAHGTSKGTGCPPAVGGGPTPTYGLAAVSIWHCGALELPVIFRGIDYYSHLYIAD